MNESKTPGLYVAYTILIGLVWLLHPATAQERGVVGWRGDGNGLFAEAAPPLTWAPDKNIIWATPMASPSNSSPLIVGDRIFVCAEPTTLLCVDKKTGGILWQRTHTYVDAAPADQKKEIESKIAELGALQKKLEETEIRFKTARTEFQDMAEDKKEAAKALIDELEKSLGAQKQALGPLQDQYGLPLIFPWTSDEKASSGYSSASPVSDGTLVFAAFGNGVVSCHDLEGQQKWMRFVERPKDSSQGGFSSTPICADGKLVVHFEKVTALAASNGETIWQIEAKPAFGTATVLTLGERQIMATPLGDLIALKDGALLAGAAGKLGFASPLASGAKLYYLELRGRAVELKDENGQVTVAELWKNRPGGKHYASALIHNDLISVCSERGELSIFHLKNGQPLSDKNKLDLGQGTVYPSLCFAGSKLFVSNDLGTTLVIEPGAEIKEVARNELGEIFRSTPVFEGRRIYIRGFKKLYCIGE